MTRTSLPFAVLTATLALSLPAQAAGLIRTFVSSSGNDSNPCTVTSPCRTFSTAYAATAAGGIITALDPAGYGQLVITGPVTVDGHGWASITAPSGSIGLDIIAGASDTVILRGLNIDGAGAAQTGIQLLSGKSLVVEDCAIRNMTNNGLGFFSTAASTQALTVSNSQFIGNGGAGVEIAPQGTGAIVASIAGSVFDGNLAGVYVAGTFGGTGPATVVVGDSVASNSGNVGFFAASSTHVSNLSLTHVQATGNQVGVSTSGANSTVFLAQSTVTGSADGYSIGPGSTINSYDDNYFADNAGNSGSLTIVSKQ